MKALAILLFLSSCYAALAQTFAVTYSLVFSPSGSNIGSNSNSISTPSGTTSSQAGYVTTVTSGAGGGISYPPGSSNYSCSETVQWSENCYVTGIGNIPASLSYTQTLTDFCTATAETNSQSGNAVGEASAGGGSYEENAYVAASGSYDYPSEDITPYARQTSTTNISYPAFVLLYYGIYGYQIRLDADLISSSAVTTQQESATGAAHSQMVLSVTGFTPSWRV